MASKAQIFEEIKNLTHEVVELVQTNASTADIVDTRDAINFVKGYSAATRDVADCITRMVEKLKDMPDD